MRIRGARIDVWTSNCREASGFGLQRGTAVLVQTPRRRRASGRHGAERRKVTCGSSFAWWASILNTWLETMSSFATYLIGYLILIGGLAFAAYLLNIPAMWIGVGVIVLVGAGVLSATSRTKMRDPAAGTSAGTKPPPTSPNA